MTVLFSYFFIIVFFLAGNALLHRLGHRLAQLPVCQKCLPVLKRLRVPFMVFSLCVVLGVGFFNLQFSCWRWTTLNNITRYAIPSSYRLEAATLGCVILVLWAISDRLHWGLFLFSALTTLVSLVNFYSIQFRQMPVTFADLANAGTAANVIGSYTIYLAWETILMLALFGGCAVLCLLCGLYPPSLPYRKGWQKAAARNLLLVLFAVCFLYKGYWAKDSLKPKGLTFWSWQMEYPKWGYLVSAMQTLVEPHALIVPEGYSPETVAEIPLPGAAQSTSEVQPDVICVLVETLFDLPAALDMETDIDPLARYHGAENALRGYTIVPAMAGTNFSEHEYLTGSSHALLPDITPFNEMKINDTSVPGLMRELGYQTYAAHPAIGTNYNRENGYPDLGFERSRFLEDFTGLDYKDAHPSYFSDESVLRNLTDWYEESVRENPDQPIFSYMLTIQNHAGFTNEKPETNLVHSKEFISNAVDEYLTCMYYSDEAIGQLMDYFSTVERPVVLCVTGDHCPDMAPSLRDTYNPTGDRDLELRKTPYLIWANYDWQPAELGDISLNYLLPSALEAAGVPVTPYLQYLLEMRQQFPILTSYGCYYTADGQRVEYDSPERSQTVQDYFYLEYNSLTAAGGKRAEQWFHP